MFKPPPGPSGSRAFYLNNRLPGALYLLRMLSGAKVEELVSHAFIRTLRSRRGTGSIEYKLGNESMIAELDSQNREAGLAIDGIRLVRMRGRYISDKPSLEVNFCSRQHVQRLI